MNMDGEGRVTKAEIEDYIATLCGVPVFNLCFTRLEDNPGVFKHCCVYTGVTVLQPTRVELSYVDIYYAVCPYCGKVLYYAEDVGGMY